MKIRALSIIVSGTVQGVFFRATAKEKAGNCSITGWVRNCTDGSVEMHAEGAQNALEDFLAWCHEGPDGADVQAVHTEEASVEGYTSFEIRH